MHCTNSRGNNNEKLSKKGTSRGNGSSAQRSFYKFFTLLYK